MNRTREFSGSGRVRSFVHKLQRVARPLLAGDRGLRLHARIQVELSLERREVGLELLVLGLRADGCAQNTADFASDANGNLQRCFWWQTFLINF